MAGTPVTADVAIECPLHPEEGPKLARARGDGFEVSVRCAEDPADCQVLVPRFLGDRCQFVATAADFAGGDDVELWTTDCPLNPETAETAACYLQLARPE